jgi:hypothetical protein
LNPFAFQVAKYLVLICGAGAASVAQQFYNRVFGRAGQTRRGTDGISFRKASDDLRSFLG